jgi:hypothetical protein
MEAAVSIAKFPTTPRLHGPGAHRPTGAGATAVGGRVRQAPGRVGAALDVARTLLLLVFIGMGIVVLRFLLELARSAIGH